ncbi:MAG: NAD(P)H-hydrate epimerase, partial [Pseudomonadota bacterium]
MDHLVGTSPLYPPAEVRARDRAAIEAGTPGYTLMARAAQAALTSLRRRWPEARNLIILCGSGNNGGDGLVLAALAPG